MKSLGNETITIVKPQITTDPRDNAQVISFDSPTLIVVKKCAFEPFLIATKLQFEETRERDFARSTWRVWMPVNPDTTALQPHDRLRYDGQDYEVYGHIGLWKDLRGHPQHIEFVVELRQG